MGLKIRIRVDVDWHSSLGVTGIIRAGLGPFQNRFWWSSRSLLYDILSGRKNAPKERSVREGCLGGVNIK